MYPDSTNFNKNLKENSLKKDSKVLPIKNIFTTKILKENSSHQNDKKQIENERSYRDTSFRFNDILDKKSVLAFDTIKFPADNISFFKDHELKVKHKYSQSSYKTFQDWIFFILLFLLITFTALKVLYYRNIKWMVGALFSSAITNQLVRGDENILIPRASLLLTIIFNCIAGLYLYQLSIVYNWNLDFVGSGFSRFLAFTLLISFIYSLKMLFLRMVSYIFDADEPITLYIYNIFLLNNILGILLIPFVISITFMPSLFVPYLIKISFIIIILFFAYRIIRGLMIGLSVPHFSILYLFLYLCTLEIAPLIILIKVFA